MTLPVFLCIGAQKAGTTWLYEQLIRHPQLWLPPVKELHYFDHRHVPRNRAWTPAHIQNAVQRLMKSHLTAAGGKVDWSYVSYLADMAARDLFSEAWYRRAFDRPRANQRLCCDITPAYCAIGQEGIEHLLTLLPEVKILYIIRDPVQRALSQLRMNATRRKSEPDEAALLAMCDEWDLANRGDYRAYVPAWRSALPPERLLFLPFGLIRHDPLAFMRRIEDFVGVAPHEGYQLHDQVHASRKFEIPSGVLARLEELFGPQRAFLEAEFGREFLEQTR